MSSTATTGKKDLEEPIAILLVDSGPESLEGVKALLLGNSEFSVITTALNGQDAVRLAKELQPDIVLMEIKLPELDGLEAASRITKALPATGVIMMAVPDGTDYNQQVRMSGSRHLLLKPLDIHLLYSTIRCVYGDYQPLHFIDYRHDFPSDEHL